MRVHKSQLSSLILILPILILYIITFVNSMITARDRAVYIRIMRLPFHGREEPLLNFIALVLSKISSYPAINLTIVQIFFIFLMVLSFNSASLNVDSTKNYYSVKNFAKFFAGLIFIFILASSVFIIQLRIGYAAIIFCYLVFGLRLKPNLKNMIWFSLPCLMHYGSIPAVILYVLFNFFKINNIKKFLPIFISSIIILTFTIKFLPDIFLLLNINPYYNDYLDSDVEYGRKYPIGVIAYLLLIFFLIFKYRKNLDIKEYFCIYGLVLVYTGSVLDFYLAYKMLFVITLSTVLLLVNKVNLSDFSSRILIVFCLIIGIPLMYLALNFQGTF